MGKWLEYRDCGGLKKERQRQFFPADAEGTIVGPMIAEQLVEHVRLNNGFAPELFERPRQAMDAQPARGWGLEAWGEAFALRRVSLDESAGPVDSLAVGVFNADRWR